MSNMIVTDATPQAHDITPRIYNTSNPTLPPPYMNSLPRVVDDKAVLIRTRCAHVQNCVTKSISISIKLAIDVLHNSACDLMGAPVVGQQKKRCFEVRLQRVTATPPTAVYLLAH